MCIEKNFKGLLSGIRRLCLVMPLIAIDRFFFLHESCIPFSFQCLVVFITDFKCSTPFDAQ